MKVMTSLERVLTTLGHREPDRVPFFLFLTMHGARELGLTIKDYFSKPEQVVEGQLRMRDRYGHDCLYGLFHAPMEVEAWGGEVIFVEDGPPNGGAPIIRTPQAIRSLVPPQIQDCPGLQGVLTALRLMKERSRGEVPIIGVVMSPFSFPVLQMGFEAYLDLIAEEPDLFNHLMAINEEFCVSWANAQLEAGATFICYFDPVSSPTIIPRELYLKTGFQVAKRTLARFNGPPAAHLASGRCLGILDDIRESGAAAVGVSALEDLATIKAACRGKITPVGNLNGIEMRHWTDKEAEQAVKHAIAAAGPGGGFILADNHGEIPWQVPERVLSAISEAVGHWGHYPLGWVGTHAR